MAKTRTVKRLCALLITCATVLTSMMFAVPVSAQPSWDEMPVEPANEAVALATYPTSSSIAPPTYNPNNTLYNMVVKYEWTAGSGGNTVVLSRYGDYFDFVAGSTYSAYEFPDYVNSAECVPDYPVGKTLNTNTGYYSAGETTIQWIEQLSDISSIVHYGYNAKYVPVGIFSYSAFTTQTVPTSYDQEHYIWSHGANSKNTIKATISYKGVISDIEVKIPPIGYKTSSVTIAGETFYLRTGPNKCSIKAGSSNVTATDIRFAFGIG